MPDILEVELRFFEGNAEVVLGKTKKNLEDFVKETEGKSPTLKFKVSGESFIDLNKLEKRAEETRKSFAAIAAQRLDNGQIGLLTKEVVRASERSRQLSSDISAIKKELSNPNRKSSIAFLTEELRAAEREADSLNRKLSSLPSQNASAGKVSSGARRIGSSRGLSELQRTGLEIADDFAPAGLNRPFNAVAKELLLINTLSAGTLATFGAIAAVGYGIVKITENIRSEAERRLKVEESIAGAMGRQGLAQKQGLDNLKKLREEAQKGREFDRSLADSTIDDLKRKKANLELLKNLIPVALPVLENGKVVSKPNERFDKNAEQLKTLDAQIDALQQKNKKEANDSFNRRFDDLVKSQESAIKAQERFNKSVQEGKQKVKELGKVYSSTFDDLFARSQKENPFVQIFSEGEKSLKSLRENLKGLPLEMQKTAIDIQQKINAGALFSAKIDNNLGAFDLRERAKSLRNPQESGERTESRINDGALRHVNAGNFFAGGVFGNYGSFLANQAGGFDKLTAAQKRDIYEVRSFGNVTGNPTGSTFNDLNQNSLTTALANDRLRGEDNNPSVNDRLQKKLAIINSGVTNESERGIADRSLLALGSGLNPAEISRGLREQLALANEREADRKSKYETESSTLSRKQIESQNRLADEINKLRLVAEKEGLAGVNKAVEILITNKSGGAADVKKDGTGKAAGNTDTRSYYEQFENR